MIKGSYPSIDNIKSVFEIYFQEIKSRFYPIARTVSLTQLRMVYFLELMIGLYGCGGQGVAGGCVREHLALVEREFMADYLFRSQ